MYDSQREKDFDEAVDEFEDRMRYEDEKFDRELDKIIKEKQNDK